MITKQTIEDWISTLEDAKDVVSNYATALILTDAPDSAIRETTRVEGFLGDLEARLIEVANSMDD